MEQSAKSVLQAVIANTACCFFANSQSPYNSYFVHLSKQLASPHLMLCVSSGGSVCSSFQFAYTMSMSGGAQPEGSHQSASSVKPALSSCRRNKSENTSFVSDLRDHIQEFIHASPDEHKTCLTKTIKRMFGMSKVVAERSAEAKEPEAESVLPLQTRVSR